MSVTIGGGAQQGDGPKYQLECGTGEFNFVLGSLKPLARKAAKLRAAKISLEFDGRFASLVCPGYAVTFNAAGEWPGRATFSANVIWALMAAPPGGELLAITTDTKRLTIGTTSVACSWQRAIIEDGVDYFSLPEPLDHLHTLQMLHRYGKDRLYQQGFQRHLRNAHSWRTRRITEALEHLSQFGVTYDDLAHVVEDAVRRGTQ